MTVEAISDMLRSYQSAFQRVLMIEITVRTVNNLKDLNGIKIDEKK